MAILKPGVAVSGQERGLGQVRESQEVGTKRYDSARRCGPDGRHIEIPPRVMVWVCRWRGQVHLNSGKSAAGWVDDLQWKNRKLAPLGVDCSTGDEDPSRRNSMAGIWHSSAMRAIRTPRERSGGGGWCLGVVRAEKGGTSNVQNFHQ